MQRARQDRGLEQTDLARKLRVSLRTVGKIEQGVRGIRDEHELQAVATALNVTPRWLTTGDVTTPRKPDITITDMLTGMPTDMVKAIAAACRRELTRRS